MSTPEPEDLRVDFTTLEATTFRLDHAVRRLEAVGAGTVVLGPEARVRTIRAPQAHLEIIGSASFNSIDCASVKAEGHLAFYAGARVSGNMEVAGQLDNERHFPIEIGGDLKVGRCDADCHVEVGGLFSAVEDILVREVTARRIEAGGSVHADMGAVTTTEGITAREVHGAHGITGAIEILPPGPDTGLGILATLDDEPDFN